RYDEAEEAYRKALELRPESIRGWMELGHLLYEKMKRYGEAEEAYRKAICLKEDHSCAWFYLARLLSDENIRQYEDAEKAYIEALKYENNDTLIWQELIRLQFEKDGKASRAFEVAKECVARQPEDWKLFNAIAWAFFKEGRGYYLREAEIWACKAVKLEPNDAGARGTYSCILGGVGKGQEALGHVKFFVENRKLVEMYIFDAMTLFTRIAALGFGREALEVLQASPSAEILEPLVVGLRLFVGEDVKVAAEIMEVGKDVMKRIQERQDKVQDK
ncbi:unnamed protein product, partial [marine sediment metagenome]